MSEKYTALDHRLAQVKKAQNYRKLPHSLAQGIDFCSNDYLGFTTNSDFQEALRDMVSKNPQHLTGSTGSRLLSGNHAVIEQTEAFIALRHNFERAVLFHSGYLANIGLLTGICTRDTTVILDQYAHRSWHDGAVLSGAKKWKFKHNDLWDLRQKLQRANCPECYVIVESLYSMDGDWAPLEEILQVCKEYGAHLIVDEAHAMGVYGLGVVYQKALQNQVFAVSLTYGKALGGSGAVILGSELLRQALVNFSPGFIYTTAPCSFMGLRIQAGYNFLQNHPELPLALQDVIAQYRALFQDHFTCKTGPIQLIYVSDLVSEKGVIAHLKQAQMVCKLIRAPSVISGSERFRITLHSYNTLEQLEELLSIFKKFKKNIT